MASLCPQYGFFVASMLGLAVPFQAVEGAIAATLAISARGRVGTRSA